MRLVVDIRRDLVSEGRTFHLEATFAVTAPFAVVYGPSGSGKSATMQAIAGLLRPDAGHIALGDRVLFDAAGRTNVPARHRRVGYVFQDYALFPHLTVADNVGFGLRGGDPRVAELLAAFELDELARSFPHELSGGQRQRVALARALAPRPDLLLLDEPFAALDPALRSRMRAELLRAVAAADTPVVLITHDPADADFFPGELLVFGNGRVVATGEDARAALRAGTGDLPFGGELG